jgi:hypothetical protein
MHAKVKVAIKMRNGRLYVRPAGIQEGEVHGQTILHGSAVDDFLDALPLAVCKDVEMGWNLVVEILREDYKKYRKQFA